MKLPFENVGAMISRMTPRERRLFGVLGGVVVGMLAAITWLASSAVFGAIREEIAHDRQVMAELLELAPRYRELSDTRKAVEDAVRSNRTSVRVAANEILKRMELVDEVPGATGNRLSDIVSFEGKTTDTPVEFGRKGVKKPPKAKGKETGGILEVEQNLEFREVPVVDLVSFLDQVEQSKDLLFVTKLDAARKFNNPRHVRAVVTIATFQSQGEEVVEAPAAVEEP
ncbi:MAG: hypothetical protein FJ087_08845 [Deltaproteobacteria bacterium]|nr:hypothetical protein [Deltaproteobacteria bacterium]